MTSNAMHPPSGCDVPLGFKLATGLVGPFVIHSGPVYGRLEGDTLVMGFRVLPHHVNPLDICHGGMLATFADILLACGAMYRADARGRLLPTISLQMDFLAAAPLGAWVEGRTEILRTTRSMIFSQGCITVDGSAAVRISCVSKIGPAVDEAIAVDPLNLRS